MDEKVRVARKALLRVYAEGESDIFFIIEHGASLYGMAFIDGAYACERGIGRNQCPETYKEHKACWLQGWDEMSEVKKELQTNEV